MPTFKGFNIEGDPPKTIRNRLRNRLNGTHKLYRGVTLYHGVRTACGRYGVYASVFGGMSGSLIEAVIKIDEALGKVNKNQLSIF